MRFNKIMSRQSWFWACLTGIHTSQYSWQWRRIERRQCWCHWVGFSLAAGLFWCASHATLCGVAAWFQLLITSLLGVGVTKKIIFRCVIRCLHPNTDGFLNLTNSSASLWHLPLCPWSRCSQVAWCLDFFFTNSRNVPLKIKWTPHACISACIRLQLTIRLDTLDCTLCHYSSTVHCLCIHHSHRCEYFSPVEAKFRHHCSQYDLGLVFR